MEWSGVEMGCGGMELGGTEMRSITWVGMYECTYGGGKERGLRERVRKSRE